MKDRSQITKQEASFTNDSVLNQLQNLDMSLQSKKFLLSSKMGGGEDIDVEQFGYEQFILGQQQLKQKHMMQQSEYRQDYD